MTPSTLAQKILRLHRAGEPLNISAAKRNHPELLAAAYSFTPFLGWKQALELAGLDYRSIRIELEPYVPCRVCGKFLKNLATHIRVVHGFEDSAGYREEFPGAKITSEEFRSRMFTSERGRLRHWEPVLSLEYVRDRAWFWRRHHGACNLDMILRCDPAIMGYSRRQGWSWDDVIRSIGLDPREERIHKKRFRVSRADILETLRLRDQQGLPNTFEPIRFEFPSLMDSIIAEFGSLAVALKKAGLPGNRLGETGRQAVIDYPTGSSVLEGLRAYSAAGHPMLWNGLVQIDPVLAAAVDARFPNFTTCVKKAGLRKAYLEARSFVARQALSNVVFEPRGKYPTLEAVVDALRARHRAGLSLKQSQVILDDPPLKTAAYLRCDTWRKAIHLAGLEKESLREREASVRKDAVYPSPEAVLATLAVRHRAHKGISQHVVSREDRPLKSAVYRYFGSWPAAMEAAGLVEALATQKEKKPFRLNRGVYPTRSAVIAALKRRVSEGKTLVLNRIIVEDSPLRTAALKHFGTWLAAIRAAGLMSRYEQENPHHKPRFPDEASVIRALRQIGKKTGLPLSSLSMYRIEQEDSNLRAAVYRFFNSWPEARRRALAAGSAAEGSPEPTATGQAHSNQTKGRGRA